jgi:amino acid adenylation domain-containing protein
MLWDAADRYGRRPAIIDDSGTTDYGRLRDRAAAVAAALSRLGVRPHDRVGIFLDAGADTVAAFFGVTAVGGIAIVINESLRPRQVEYMLEHASAAVLITSTNLLDRQPRPLETVCRILDVAEIPAASSFGPISRDDGDAAQITYTSGSTGLPKGVTITHANLWAAMRAVTSYLGIVTEDRIASVLPFSFVYGMSQVLCAVGSGATLVIERSPLMQQLALRLRAREVSVLAAVPPLWLQLVQMPAFRAPWPSLRIITNAGGHLPVPTVRALREAQPQAQLFLMYGLTEVLRSTFLPPDEVDRRPDSIGRAIPEAEVFVLRDDLTLCSPGEVGELVHCGPTVTLGYWNDPDATARVFRPHPLRRGAPADDDRRVVFSGDLVRRDEQGYLYYVGRRDRVIKTLGYRVSPEEIANVLYASGEILEAVVTSEQDEVRGERIAAFVVLVEGGSLERLQEYCESELPYYMQPARFELRDALPRLPSGKHDLAAMQQAQPRR